MQIEELKQACRAKIASGGEAIVLVTDSCRLCGRRGPIGELLCVNADGSKIVRFDAAKVLQFLVKAEKQNNT